MKVGTETYEPSAPKLIVEPDLEGEPLCFAV